MHVIWTPWEKASIQLTHVVCINFEGEIGPSDGNLWKSEGSLKEARN